MRTFLFFFILLLCQNSIAQDKQQISFEQYDLLSKINTYYPEVIKFKEIQQLVCDGVLIFQYVYKDDFDNATSYRLKFTSEHSVSLDIKYTNGTVVEAYFTIYNKDVIKTSHTIINNKYKYSVSVNGKVTYTY